MPDRREHILALGRRRDAAARRTEEKNNAKRNGRAEKDDSVEASASAGSFIDVQ